MLLTMAKPGSYLLVTTSATGLFADVTSLGEHTDALIKILCVVGLIAAFWIRGWIVRQEVLLSKAQDKLEAQALAIEGLKVREEVRAEELRRLRWRSDQEKASWAWLIAATGQIHTKLGLAEIAPPRPRDSGEYRNPTLEGQEG